MQILKLPIFVTRRTDNWSIQMNADFWLQSFINMEYVVSFYSWKWDNVGTNINVADYAFVKLFHRMKCLQMQLCLMITLNGNFWASTLWLVHNHYVCMISEEKHRQLMLNKPQWCMLNHNIIDINIVTRNEFFWWEKLLCGIHEQ